MGYVTFHLSNITKEVRERVVAELKLLMIFGITVEDSSFVQLPKHFRFGESRETSEDVLEYPSFVEIKSPLINMEVYIFVVGAPFYNRFKLDVIGMPEARRIEYTVYGESSLLLSIGTILALCGLDCFPTQPEKSKVNI